MRIYDNYGLARKYNIISVIKEDCKGKVSLVKDKITGVKRVVKEVSLNSKYKDSILREAVILKNLNHHYIPTIINMFQNDQSIFIVEEYIEGQNMYEYIIENGLFSQEKASDYGAKLADIIKYLHTNESFRVCHLDIQPKNIIINKNQIFLIDFGNGRSAKDCGNGSPIMATEGFAPPEQYNNGFPRTMDQAIKADLYSLKAVMLYMETGQVYTNNKEENNTDIDMKTKKEFNISVAGIQSGVGATYTALGLTAALNRKGQAAVYKENNDHNTVRGMARSNKDIRFEQGYFTFQGCKMMPKYSENVRIEQNENIAIRDEGVFNQDGVYGDLLILVMKNDFLGRVTFDKVKNSIREYIDRQRKTPIAVINQCGGNFAYDYAEEGFLSCHRVSYSDDPFQSITGESNIIGEIINYLHKEVGRDYKEEKRKSLWTRT